MGDGERSIMEDQKVLEEDMKNTLGSPPVHPLPDEIQQMEHSETVCRYCGVSYLILHAFHKLQSQIAQLEAELQRYREEARTEKAQREALERGRLDWERDLLRQTEEREKDMRDESQALCEAMARTLREEFGRKQEKTKGELEDEFERRAGERERSHREELGKRAEETERQREEREEREEREKVLREALQKANKELEDQSKYRRQLKERLAEVSGEMEELLSKKKDQCQVFRGVCIRQHQALRATLSLLHSSGCDLRDVRGFLSQFAGAWQACRSKLLQHCTQMVTELRQELQCSSVEFQKATAEKAHLTQQLMKQRKQREKQLSHQRDSEKEYRANVFRLTEELKEKGERWLACQQRCDSLQEQLSAWQQREEQVTRKCFAAEEKVTSLKRALVEAQQEASELRRESERMVDSHSRALTGMEEKCRQHLALKLAAALEDQRAQNALYLKEKRAELCKEVELELMSDREKSQLLLQRYQTDSTQLQRKLEENQQEVQRLQEELDQERQIREEERRDRMRKEEERIQELIDSQQQEALQLSHTKHELELLTERNTELQEEVTLLQETVRRECEERGELTVALTQTREQLFGLRASVSCLDRRPHSHSQARIPLCRRCAPHNTLRNTSPPGMDAGEGRRSDGGQGLRSWNGGGAEGGRREGGGRETVRESMLPKLSTNRMAGGKRNTLMMGRRDRL